MRERTAIAHGRGRESRRPRLYAAVQRAWALAILAGLAAPHAVRAVLGHSMRDALGCALWSAVWGAVALALWLSELILLSPHGLRGPGGAAPGEWRHPEAWREWREARRTMLAGTPSIPGDEFRRALREHLSDPARDGIAILQAENTACGIPVSDRRYGVLAAGVQGSGKSSVLLALFMNDLMDCRAAQIVIDPKSELVHRCFELIPADHGKEVWYLDLGDPAFGMTPLRMGGDVEFATEAAAVAESFVAALLAINEGQIFQSSRRYLYHAVIGALAIARCHPDLRHALLEHVYALLLPREAAMRQAAATACQRLGLDQTAFFFAQELPDELFTAAGQTAARLDAPRNKVAGLVGVPPLRRFFQHPHDVSLRDIVERRGILLVNANMATIGEDNAQACVHFIFQMLHRQMQRHMLIAENRRPRTAVICDEAHYLFSRTVVKQIATHRAAGMDMAAGIQYLAQLGAGAESASVTEEIRKGVTNLLQSRFLFRLSDPKDADEVVRIAMALLSTITQQDPDSRIHRRVAPEVMLNIENWYCLASWITGGARVGSFIGRTYPIPDVSRDWAEHHLREMRRRLGPGPHDFVKTLMQANNAEQLLEGINRSAPIASARREDQAPALPQQDRCATPDPGTEAAPPAPHPGRDTRTTDLTGLGSRPASATAPVEKLFNDAPLREDPHLTSPVLRVFGRPVHARATTACDREPGPAPQAIRELVLTDRLSAITRWQSVPKPVQEPRLFDVDLAILKLLDRAGVLLTPLIARACMPDKAEKTVRTKLSKLYRAGLIARGEIDVIDRTQADGRLPAAVRLTEHGFKTAQRHQVIDPDKQWRESEISARAQSVPHDQHVIAWITALERLLGPRVVTDNWRTPRTRGGTIPVPSIGDGRSRHVMRASELRAPSRGYGVDGPCVLRTGDQDKLVGLAPDATIELKIASMHLTFDLMLEITLAAKPSHNERKLAAYDAFLLGWYRHHRRYQHLKTRPVVVFAFQTEEAMRASGEIADRTLDGRVGIVGTPQTEWYWPARRHVFFALEQDLHHGSLRCYRLPPLPAGIRAQLDQPKGPALAEVSMLPPTMAIPELRA